MPRLETDELLKDARLVLDYAVRTGRLFDDELPKAINAVEAAPSDGGGQSLTPLINALNNGIRAIAPITLVELRAGQSPFDPQNQRLTKKLQMLFCVLTIALTAVVASFTEYLHRQETALKALQQVQDSHPLDKLNALRRMVRFEKVLDKESSIHHDQYHRAVRELRDLQNKLSGTYELVSKVADNPPWSFALRLFDRTDAYSAPPEVLAAAQEGLNNQPDECDPKAHERLRGTTNYAPWLKSVIADLVEELCFATKTNLLLSLPPTSGPAFQIQTSMAALSGWVLPFMYGLLGGLVYVLRDLLNPRTPTMGLFATLLRVALGGIAGIIIGWFWVPSPSNGAELASISSVPFGLAFLTGFSIDIFFSLLDRLNRTVSDAPNASPPA